MHLSAWDFLWLFLLETLSPIYSKVEVCEVVLLVKGEKMSTPRMLQMTVKF